MCRTGRTIYGQPPGLGNLYRDCSYTVRKPIWETSTRECPPYGHRPVFETSERECRRIVAQLVVETVNQERCYTVMKR